MRNIVQTKKTIKMTPIALFITAVFPAILVALVLTFVNTNDIKMFFLQNFYEPLCLLFKLKQELSSLSTICQKNTEEIERLNNIINDLSKGVVDEQPKKPDADNKVIKTNLKSIVGVLVLGVGSIAIKYFVQRSLQPYYDFFANYFTFMKDFLDVKPEDANIQKNLKNLMKFDGKSYLNPNVKLEIPTEMENTEENKLSKTSSIDDLNSLINKFLDEEKSSDELD